MPGAIAMYDTGQSISRGWNAFTNNVGTSVVCGLVFLVITGGVSGVLENVVEKVDAGAIATIGLNIVTYLIDTTVTTFLTLGLVHVCLNMLENKPAEVAQLFGQGDKLVQGFLATILVHLLTLGAVLPGSILAGVIAAAGAPFIALVIGFVTILPAAFYMIAATIFTNWLIVDAELDAVTAIKGSFRMSQGIKIGLTVFMFATALILIVGVLALCVGILAAIPVIYLAWGAAYLSVRPNMDSADAQIGFKPN